MKMKAVFNDAGRLEWLKQLLQTATLPTEFGDKLLPQRLINQATAVNDQMIQTSGLVTNLLATRRKQVEEMDARLLSLSQTCRAFWNVVVWRVKALKLSGQLLKIIGLPLNGARPYITRKREWLTIAEALLTAEQEAVAQGYPAMDPVLLTSLTTHIDGARASFLALDMTHHQLIEAHKIMDGHRTLSDELKIEIRRYFDYILLRESPAHRRKVMRSYGYIFEGGVTESDDQPDTTDLDPNQTEPGGTDTGTDPTDQGTDPGPDGIPTETGESTTLATGG